MNRMSALLEIGVQEMPSAVAPDAAKQLARLARDMLSKSRLAHKTINVFYSPRRLALYIEAISPKQPDAEIEARGPAAKDSFDAEGRPTRALEDFARSQGVSVEHLQVRDTPAGQYVFATRKQTGISAAKLLRQLFPQLIHSIEFTKPMRWGEGEFRFTRPIRWLVALLGAEVVEFEAAGVKSGKHSRGHRVLANAPVEIRRAEQYVSTLRGAYVMVDAMERRAAIRLQVDEQARLAGGSVTPDEALLSEVTNIVEWPTAFTGTFPEESLLLPEPVLVSVMKHHQRYFAVRGSNSKLLPLFIGVRDGGSQQITQVVLGNEKVLRARLEDAEFFFAEDLKRSPEAL